MKEIMRLINDESGQGMIEYAFIISLVILVVVTALPLIAQKVQSLLQPANDILGK
ncbi:MAG: Flp family type IVb pilin [Lachnospiraceae bacterium]|nr:Flp family type IVb pilin [Lachnospiraceae bacterium]